MRKCCIFSPQQICVATSLPSCNVFTNKWHFNFGQKENFNQTIQNNGMKVNVNDNDII